MHPQTWGTVSPRAGAAPWLRAVQPNVVSAGQVFQAGGGAGGWASRPAMVGGGAVTPDTSHVRFWRSHVYVIEPQLPYEQLFPGDAQAPPCTGASFGQPSVRFA